MKRDNFFVKQTEDYLRKKIAFERYFVDTNNETKQREENKTEDEQQIDAAFGLLEQLKENEKLYDKWSSKEIKKNKEKIKETEDIIDN